MKQTKPKRKPTPKAKPAEGLNAIYTENQLDTLNEQLHLARHACVVWSKFTVTVKDQFDLVVSMPLARAIYTRPVPENLGLYFARYTAHPPRIEIQVCRSNALPVTEQMDTDLARYILLVCRKAGLRGVKVAVEPCVGSRIHMMAFQMAMLMEDQDANSLSMVTDVTHWLSNMLGFSYAQEAEANLRHTHVMLSNAVGYSEKPVFQNPLVVYRQARQALQKMEESKQAVFGAPKPGKGHVNASTKVAESKKVTEFVKCNAPAGSSLRSRGKRV